VPATAVGPSHVHAAACAHGHHAHDHDHDHAHDHPHAPAPAAARAELVAATGEHDAHSLAHAADINRRFAGRHVTTSQIVLFGLTGGLIPCPASITVLLLCLQLKRVALGAVLVLGFSIGLALTMVASGVVAALSVKHLSKRLGDGGRFGEIAAKAPYFSGVLILLVGLYVGWQGVHALG
jgi:ABC-type nickel/cobalt efflux system permease component RcnA